MSRLTDEEILEIWNDLRLDQNEALRAIADAAGAAERNRCIVIIEKYQVPVGNSAAGEMAAEWTIDALQSIRNEITCKASENNNV